ncbi:uncharacterized protein LOC119613624 [Lucilia sericata]|uniref:uncharacterized protein LOC119613624 n=1 Tax=Lucilia sericata TaxID=13632 RepID=UPI0018A85FBC|nr:uncharacterized protein LOC119613624 [Lucilia sericata]
METNNIYTFFMVLFLIQISLTYTKPVKDTYQFYDTSEEDRNIRTNPTVKQKLLLFTYDSFISLGLQYANNADVVSNRILNDESLMTNTNPEILEFKNKLKQFVEKYESSRNIRIVWDLIDMYTAAVEKYFDIPEDKVTPETSYILELLKKHKGIDVATRFAAEFKKFENNFVSMFEENKEHLEKPMLDWYEKFKSINTTEKKIDAFSGFLNCLSRKCNVKFYK